MCVFLWLWWLCGTAGGGRELLLAIAARVSSAPTSPRTLPCSATGSGGWAWWWSLLPKCRRRKIFGDESRADLCLPSFTLAGFFFAGIAGGGDVRVSCVPLRLRSIVTASALARPSLCCTPQWELWWWVCVWQGLMWPKSVLWRTCASIAKECAVVGDEGTLSWGSEYPDDCR